MVSVRIDFEYNDYEQGIIFVFLFAVYSCNLDFKVWGP